MGNWVITTLGIFFERKFPKIWFNDHEGLLCKKLKQKSVELLLEKEHDTYQKGTYTLENEEEIIWPLLLYLLITDR